MLPYYSDATMWGPQGDPNKERPRLRLNYRVWAGLAVAKLWTRA